MTKEGNLGDGAGNGQGVGERLELFEVIEETVGLLGKGQAIYEEALNEIVNLLESVLREDNQQIIAFKSRLKSKVSLKEKIIRRGLYKQHKNPRVILDSIPDVVGVLAECRFTADEVKIYTRLKENFFLTTEEGLYYNPALPNLFFWLSMKQPQIQKNGLEAYKVDGLYLKNDQRIRFELQIKSMINSFWSEVEHEIIYKNNAYLPNDQFIRTTLDTLKTNLDGIDNMLMHLSSRLMPKKEKRHVFSDLGYGNFLALMISDIYMKKMSDSLGFTVDFRKTCEVLGYYVARKHSSDSQENLRYMMFRLSNSFIQAREKKTNFEEKILFAREFQADNQFSLILGRRLQILANTDYEWHVFFKMLFEIEDGENIDDLELFVLVLYKAYANEELYESLYRRLDREIADQVKEDILALAAEVLADYGSIQIIYQECLDRMMDAIQWAATFLGEDGALAGAQGQQDMIRQQFKIMVYQGK